MFKNSIKLPLLALIFASVGVLVLVWDLKEKAQRESAAALPPAGGKRLPSSSRPLQLDGVIVEGEYQNVLQPSELNMELFWTIRGDRIFVGLRAPTQGWVALGLAPEGPLMKGADIIIGYVKQGQLYLQDSYADSPAGHQSDEKLGGRDDILGKAGSEDQGVTTLEFSRKLETGDPYDKAIREGERVTLLLAYATQDDFTSYHAKSRALLLNIDLWGGSR